MEPKDKLAKQPRAMTAAMTQSIAESAQTLAAELKLTAMNAKTELEPYLVQEFSRVLLDFPAKAVEAAFRGWRDVSPYFPAVCEIRELCLLWVRRTAENRELEEQAKRRQETELARERGELIEWPQVVKKFNEICEKSPKADLVKKMPEAPPEAEIVVTPERRELLRQQAEKVKEIYGKKA